MTSRTPPQTPAQDPRERPRGDARAYWFLVPLVVGALVGIAVGNAGGVTQPWAALIGIVGFIATGGEVALAPRTGDKPWTLRLRPVLLVVSLLCAGIALAALVPAH